MKIGTWNIRSAGSLKAAARELARYKLDVVGAQEVRWDNISTGKEMKIINWEQVFLYTVE